jgi:HK97 family phage prohead protease
MGTLTAIEIGEMRATDRRRRALRDDDELRLRGIGAGERKFDPGQKRDDHGRWSKIGAALHAIAKAAGAAVVGHETFGAEAGDSHSHGLVVAHPGGDFTLALPDKDSGARPLMVLPDDDAREEMRQGFEDVADAHRRDPASSGSIEADDGSWQVQYNEHGAVLYANLDDDAELEEVHLSHDDVETLESALANIGDALRNAEAPDYTPPLAPGEEVRPRSRKRLGSSGDEFVGAVEVVDTADGPRVRLGAIAQDENGIKNWTGGHGQTTVDLDQADAAKIADVLEEFDAAGKERQKTYDMVIGQAERAAEDGTDVDWNDVSADIVGRLGGDSEDDFGEKKIETPWGTIRLTDVGMDDEANAIHRHVRLEIWPTGMSEEEYDAGNPDHAEWAWPGSKWQKPVPQLQVKDIRALIKLLRGSFATASPERARPAERLMKWDPTEHPRAPKGSDAGGEFAKGSGKTSGGSTSSPKTKAGGKADSGRGPRVRIPRGALGYDPASNHGTGYGVKGGDKRVHTLQRALNRLGFTDMHGKKLRDDGQLGPLTTAALLKRIEAMKPNPRRARIAKSATTTKRRSAAMELCTRAFDFEFDGDVRDGRTLEGYAAVFNTPARIRDLQGDFDETIAPGAFKRSLARRTPVLQFDHGKDPRIGGTPIGKIDALSEDSRGLHVRARLFTHPDVERVREAIAEGAVSGMSFRFGVPDKGDVWGRNADGVDTRKIRDADIHELGPVVFPAYDQTSVSVRSLLSQLGPEETRELLHELAGHLGLAVDLEDLTGRPSARSAGGGDIGTSPGVGRVPAATPSTRQLLDHGTLRLKGIIK